MKIAILAFAAALVVVSTVPSFAQAAKPSPAQAAKSHEPARRYIAPNSRGSGATVYGGQPYAVAAVGWPWRHAATVAESWALGWAEAARAEGQFARDFAAAQIAWQTAHQMAIDNRAAAIRTNREIRDEYAAREKALHPPMTIEQQRAISRFRDPARLSVSQLSPSGEIAWPSALQSKEYSASRSRLDALFSERARGSTVSSGQDFTLQVEASARQMLATLTAGAGQIPVMEQVAAKNLINSLRLEAHLPLGDRENDRKFAAR